MNWVEIVLITSAVIKNVTLLKNYVFIMEYLI